MNALALGLVAALCWGFHDVCARFLSQKTAVSACIFTVLLTGLVFHTGLTVATGTLQTMPAPAVFRALAAGFFFVVATFGLYYAFQRGPVRLVAPLIAAYPILSVSWAAFQGVPVSGLQWLAVIAIVVGVSAVAILSDNSAEKDPPIGPTILFAVIAAIAFACTFALGQSAAALSHDMPSTLVTRLVSFALVVGIVAILKLPIWPGKQALPWLLAMGIADGIALMCVLSAGALPNAKYAAVSSSLFGMLTIVLAWMFLKERMTLPQWAGCAVAFAGVGYLAL
ncbi:MAG: DMT family transporter [Tateyamaria sp.]|uniref:EamA family transporter n=1 Tax=Tateyamaria sp. TaxID=1929288 RepID=UPI00329502C5